MLSSSPVILCEVTQPSPTSSPIIFRKATQLSPSSSPTDLFAATHLNPTSPPKSLAFSSRRGTKRCLHSQDVIGLDELISKKIREMNLCQQEKVLNLERKITIQTVDKIVKTGCSN